MPSTGPLFHLHGTREQDRVVRGALDRCDFPWTLLRPGLLADTGRERIPVGWGDQSGNIPPDPVVTNLFGERAYVIRDGEGRPVALAWRSGRITLDLWMCRPYPPAHRAALTAAAYMVDLFWLSDRQRGQVHAICDPADWTLPDGFLAAFTDLPTPIPCHAAAAIRATMLGTTDGMPAQYVASRRVWHHPMCWIITAIRRPEPAGYLPPPHLRPCRLCKPDQPSGLRRGDDGL